MLDRVLNNVGKPDATDVPSRGSAAEQELVAAAKRGDESAFETLFNRHQRRISTAKRACIDWSCRVPGGQLHRGYLETGCWK